MIASNIHMSVGQNGCPQRSVDSKCIKSSNAEFPVLERRPSGYLLPSWKVIIPLVSFLDTKGNTPRPSQHHITNITRQSFEVAPNLVNTNPVKSSPAFAVYFILSL